MKNEEPQSG